MSPKVLRRCSICKNFHASYLVVDPILGNGYYCYSCWKAWQAAHLAVPTGNAENIPDPPMDLPIEVKPPQQLKTGTRHK